MTPNAHLTLRWQDLGQKRSEWASFTKSWAGFHYTYSARAALYQLLLSMPRERGDTILLPAFHCLTVVEPVLRAGYKVRFYRIRQDLSVDTEDLGNQMGADVAAILVIHFLGFPAKLDSVLQLRKQFGCFLIEDWAHSFLTGPKPHIPGDDGDFALLSFYKLAPSFAGGGLRINSPVNWLKTPSHAAGWRQTAIAAKRMLEQVVDNSTHVRLRTGFQALERWRVAKKRKTLSVPLGAALQTEQANQQWSEHLATARIPWICRKILEASDWKRIFELRQRNYGLFVRHLNEHPRLRKLFPSLPAEVCPWAFPVWLPARAEHDIQLRARGVPLFTFGETLHPSIAQCPASARKDAEELANHLLLLSVHQNLNPEDIRRTCAVINEFFS